MSRFNHTSLSLKTIEYQDDDITLLQTAPPPPQSPTDHMLSPCTKLLYGPKKLLNHNHMKEIQLKISNLSILEQLNRCEYINPCEHKDVQLILGSSSKNRKLVLDTLQWKYQQISADIDEKAIRCIDPLELPVLIAKAKTNEIISKLNNSNQSISSALIITFDQIVLYKNEIREKPIDSEQVIKYLTSYSNEIATTISAVVITHIPSMKQQSSIDVATIYWNEITLQTINDILNTKDHDIYSAAGGICITNDHIKNSIKYTDKSIDSIMGIPMNLTLQLMKTVLHEVENDK